MGKRELKSTEGLEEKYFKPNDVKLLTESYYNNRDYLEYVCVCGKIAKVVVAEVPKLREFRCPDCREKKVSWTYSKFKQIAEDKGSKLLSIDTNGVENNSLGWRIILTCGNCGENLDISACTFKKKYKHNIKFLCGICSNHKFYSKKFLQDKYFTPKNAEILSEKITQQRKIKFKCSCGKESSLWLGNLLHDKNKLILCEDCLASKRLKTLKEGFSNSFDDWSSSRLPQDSKFLTISSEFWNVADREVACHHIYPFAEDIKRRTSFFNIFPLPKEVHGSPRSRGDYYTELHYPMSKPSLLPNNYDNLWYPHKVLLGYQQLNNSMVNEIIFPLDLSVNSMEGRTTAYSPNSLLEQKRLFAEKNIFYIPIYYAELKMKKEIIFSMLLNRAARYMKGVHSLLNRDLKVLYARNLKFKEVSSQEATIFYMKNHIQGGINSAVNLALVSEDGIEMMMSFSKARFKNKEQYELTRMASKCFTSIVGGASKLFFNFIKLYNPKSIISYCDRRFSDYSWENTIYPKLNFKFIGETKPNYFYTDRHSKVLFARQQCTKDKLSESLKDLDLSEEQLAKKNNLIKQYDCGSFKFIWDHNM